MCMDIGPKNLKFGTDPGEVRGNRSGFDVVTHVHSKKAESVRCRFTGKMMRITERHVRCKSRGVSADNATFKGGSKSDSMSLAKVPQ